MQPGHRLRCLGYPTLFAPNGDPIRLRTKKHLALLVYLAVEPRRAHRRDRLAELLWPRVSLPEGRHSLATALSVLRARLGRRAFDTGRDHVRLAVGNLELDLDRLLAGDVVGNDVVPPLEVAAFLDGFDIPDAPDYMHWRDCQQARLLPAIKAGLIRLMDLCRRTADSRQIAFLADRMLALDDLSEEAIRAKMEAYAFAGDRLSALRTFEDWAEKLRAELGAAPSPLLEGIAMRLRRRGWERTALSDIPTVRTDQWRDRVFVGRASEFRVLYEAWEQTARRAPVHCLVLGDSGIGKTTLVERLTTAAGLEGAAISRVQCYEIERDIPYAAVGSLVQGLLGQPGASATSPEALAELGLTVPEVRQRFPGLPAPIDSQGETARIRLTEAVHELLGAVAEEHPVILVVDDLHLADDASLAVLHLVMRKAREQPIMVIFTARAAELQQSPHAARLREGGASLRLRDVELAPLGDEESHELLRALVPDGSAPPGPTVRRALLRAARGYPMVLELLMQDWQMHGDQSLALAVDAMTAEPGTGAAPTAAYKAILERIVHGLDTTAQNVLNLAAILGHRLNDLEMYRLVDLTMGQTMAALGTLVRHRVLRDGGRGMEFVNELMRAQVYLQVPSTIRRALHGRVADEMIAAHAAGKTELGLEIAWHCMRAGRKEEASSYLLEGAREASRRGAMFEAERGLSTALPHLPHDTHVEAVVLLSEVLQEQGQWIESLELLESNPAAIARSPGRVLLIAARQFLENRSGNFDASTRDRLAQLIEVISSDQPRSRGLAASVAASLVSRIRDQEAARAVLAATRKAMVGNHPLPEAEHFLLAEAQLLYLLRDTEASLTHTLAAVDKLEARGVVNSTLQRLYTGLGAIACRRGMYEQAEAALTKAYELARRLDNDTFRAAAAAQLALCLTRQGKYGQVIRWVEVGKSARTSIVHTYTDLQFAYYAGMANALEARYPAALTMLDDLRNIPSSELGPWQRQARFLMEADVLLLVGRRREAFERARRGLGMPEPTLIDLSFAGLYSRWLALSASSEQDRAKARYQVHCLRTRAPELDALDQAEITCAAEYLRPANERSYREEIQSLLARLPCAVADQLSMLGFRATLDGPSRAGPSANSRAGTVPCSEYAAPQD